MKISEDILLLEDNKRIEDINNTHTEGKKIEKENLNNLPAEIQQILKKYCDLGLTDFNYKPDNYILLGAYRELGAVKLFEALTLMSQSEFVKNNTPEA